MDYTPTKVEDFGAIKIRLASPEEVLSWSHGEVTKPETINYRTQRPEKDGLFCERIFGPEKDWECYCGKYRRIRHKGVVCDKCGVEVTRSIVRRDRMGHIALATPVAHIWFLRGVPSRIGTLLDIPVQQLERVIYFNGFIVTKVHEDAFPAVLEEIEREYQTKKKSAKKKAERAELEAQRERARAEVLTMKKYRVLTEAEYFDLSLRYAHVFEAGIGAEAIRQLLADMDLAALEQELLQQVEGSSAANVTRIYRRLRIVRAFFRTAIHPEWMILTTLPVLPADLRPMVQLDGGRYASSDLNDLYRRVINRNNRLKYLQGINAPEVIQRNEKRMLQEAVDSLIDNSMRRGPQAAPAAGAGKRPLKSLADILKGKQGRFRQNLLGKRVDYSGRSVIVIGPDLGLGYCGLPKIMALELFKPFVIQKLLEQELAHNIRAASHLIDEAPPEVWAALEEVIKDKMVLLNRAPTLHRLGIQAFKPILIEGEAIQIPALVCPAFNADFDGDQMAVHVPLSLAAQEEARTLMYAGHNLLKSANGLPIAVPRHDIVLGCYWATVIRPGVAGEGRVFSSFEEADIAGSLGIVEIGAQIKVPVSKPMWRAAAHAESQDAACLVETTLGRLHFNALLPEDFPFVNDVLNAKKLEKLVADIFERYGSAPTAALLDAITRFGFEYATRSGISWGMNDLVVPQEKKALIEQGRREVAEISEQYANGLLTEAERRARVVETWMAIANAAGDAVPRTLDPAGPVFAIVDSGSRGNWGQPRQMAGMKGLVRNPAGLIIELPILSSLKEGFNVLEYFIATHGARKGTADTALRTASAGYLTRRLVDVAQEIMVSEEDCRDTKGVTFKKSDTKDFHQDFSMRILGRHSLADIAGESGAIVEKGALINKQMSDVIVGSERIEEVTVRSPLSCRSETGVCRKCYGWDLGRNELVALGAAVGVVAAQSIGEPGTQLTMRTFHTGGIAGGGDITLGLPRVEEIFEARPPRNPAVIADVDGVVMDIRQGARGEKEIVVDVHSAPGPRKRSVAEGVEGEQESETQKKNDRERTARRAPKAESRIYTIPPSTGMLAAKGDEITKGRQLCEGSVDIKELFNVAGIRPTQAYIVREIQRIYVMEGVSIHDKHIEIMVRQMFSRARIRDAGDTVFTPRQTISRSQLIRENHRVAEHGGKPATAQQLLLGITKASLTTSSFLAAASFQETARVLITAAIEASRDELRGLKENIIAGKLIPTGTGFRTVSKRRASSQIARESREEFADAKAQPIAAEVLVSAVQKGS